MLSRVVNSIEAASLDGVVIYNCMYETITGTLRCNKTITTWYNVPHKVAFYQWTLRCLIEDMV